jgi:acetylornithine deacetylase/succinyl-diaminopimelate desuccinylase-like protein
MTKTETDVIAAVDRYIDEHFEESVAELERLCRQPSVSAQGLGIRECAELTATILREHGFESEIQPTAGNPVVNGRQAGDGARTLLLYNHYDVQPPEPLELWTAPPFEPSRRDGKLFARGASDDKGHIVCRLMAIDALRAVRGSLPCNVTFLIEGEEESGSVNLEPYIAGHREALAADACLWEFGGVNHKDQAVITAGMRGMCYVQLSVRTATLDAHSGLGGSIFPNAAWRLAWALASIKGPDERIRIPGHYDDVVPASAADMELLAALPAEEDHLRETYGVQSFLGGASGVELQRRQIFEPTCTINGLDSGYQGPGTKTVLPAEAYAKIDFRLVPNQDPDKVFAALRAHLDAQGFTDVATEMLCGEHPARVDPHDPFVQLVVDAAREVYGDPVMLEPMSGGTGPAYPFLHHLNVVFATSGVGYPGGRVHAPDEHLRLDDLKRGARHTARVMLRL